MFGTLMSIGGTVTRIKSTTSLYTTALAAQGVAALSMESSNNSSTQVNSYNLTLPHITSDITRPALPLAEPMSQSNLRQPLCLDPLHRQSKKRSHILTGPPSASMSSSEARWLVHDEEDKGKDDGAAFLAFLTKPKLDELKAMVHSDYIN
ncbi:hypothetical protein K439DRAFT_1623334 [Ramaria rubella]|nr:hypothetical protein K439DRAFT_1623334 [Ramaria rubella]